MLGAFYRLLRCNFTKWPSENSTDEELLNAGIAEQHQLPFRNLIGLVKENTTTGLDKRRVIIAPNLNSLTGFRGLLLHRKYLRSSAHSVEMSKIPALSSSNSAANSHPTAVEYVAGPSQANYEFEFEPTAALRNYTIGRQVMAQIPENSYCTGMPGMPGIPANPSISQVPMQAFHTMPPAMPAMSVMNYMDNSHCGMGQMPPQCVPNLGFIPQQVTAAQNCGMPPNAATNYHPANQMFGAPIRAAEMNESIESANARFYQRSNPHEQPTVMVSENQPMESAEPELLPSFGSAKADAVLLSRLISAFFWPGIMSSIGVPKEMMDSANERARGILEQQKLTREKQQEALK